jgi:uncharacterized Zn-finger protein
MMATPSFDEARGTRRCVGGGVMEPPEIIYMDRDAESVGCDGGGGPLGHPLVYYTFGTRNQVDCGYCGRRFIRGREPASAA